MTSEISYDAAFGTDDAKIMPKTNNQYGSEEGSRKYNVLKCRYCDLKFQTENGKKVHMDMEHQK